MGTDNNRTVLVEKLTGHFAEELCASLFFFVEAMISDILRGDEGGNHRKVGKRRLLRVCEPEADTCTAPLRLNLSLGSAGS